MVNIVFPPGPIETSMRSVLLAVDEAPPDVVHAIRMATIEHAEALARQSMGPAAKLITRALIPTDLGLANARWTETTGTAANAYATTSISASTIADDTYIGIWGVRLFSPGTTIDNDASLAAMEQQQFPISVLRIIVGGARVIQWDLYPLLTMQIDLAESSAFRPRAGIALTPVTIGPNKVLQIDEYCLVASAIYSLAFEGVVVEPEGTTLRP